MAKNVGESYRMNYFPFPARGEKIRFILAHLEIEFDDHIITYDEFPTFRENVEKCPHKSLPTFEITREGNAEPLVLVQSDAIVRYLARRHKLQPEESEYDKMYEQDMLIDTINELFLAIVKPFFNKDPEMKKQRRQEAEPKCQILFPFFEKIVKKNKGHFFLGDTLTVSDILFASMWDTFQPQEPNYLDKYPLLKELNERVVSTPGLKKYLEKRGPPRYPNP